MLHPLFQSISQNFFASRRLRPNVCIQADIKNVKCIDKVDPFNRYVVAVVLNISRSFHFFLLFNEFIWELVNRVTYDMIYKIIWKCWHTFIYTILLSMIWIYFIHPFQSGGQLLLLEIRAVSRRLRPNTILKKRNN